MMYYARRAIARLALPALALALTVPAAAQDEPEQIVRQTTDTLFELVDANRSEYEQDIDALRERLRKILLPRVDVMYSGRLVLGRNARGLSREQVSDFADALSELLIRQYADGLLEFQTRDQVSILPLAGENTERMTRVKTRVALANGQEAPVDYVFRKVDGEWKIFDVIVEGISYVTTFRSQIGEQIRQEGFDATLDALERGDIKVRVDD